ncbi:uncharacterized protein J4E88_003598 [Alternaria novae-zelandiae]|uniref:uncharacterized protein n=1 Tax=Alternaria novae-zelandiae TaxID=430562 RepID=UPI0020C2C084|nr:uncharacterized protein J4E88_003598 [Alternaria novae-zelandiae]KAI4685762.1 hypothetical protein J4E88_003598 [Alternaria novae-zelandiae]
MSSQLAASKSNQAALITKPAVQESNDVVVEQIHPEKPDHQDCPEFQEARKHEAFLQHIHASPAWMAEMYFSKMSDQTRQDFDETTDKTKRYWAQHPDLFLLHFGNSGSSSEASSGNQSTLPTQGSSDLAEDDGHGGDKTFIHAPKPRREQRIATNLEEMIERADSSDPISSATYEAGHAAPDRMSRQPGNYETFQSRWQQRLYALWWGHQNYTRPSFVHWYPEEFTQWRQGQQLPPYQQCHPQPPPGYSQHHAAQPMYPPEYHARYQQQYMPWQPGYGYYRQFPVRWPAHEAHQRPQFNSYADEMTWRGFAR